MADSGKFDGVTPAWCPGCGNFGILGAFKKAMADLGLEPHQLIVVSGIGQAGKFPHYTRCNTFNGLHGRGLPVATGIRLAGAPTPVIAVAGDGDAYGEGGNHLIHAIRRNIDVKFFVHDNQVYGLTKGQASPTSMMGMKTKAQPEGAPAAPAQPARPGDSARLQLRRQKLRRRPGPPRPDDEGGDQPQRLRAPRHPPALRNIQPGQHVPMVRRQGLPPRRLIRPHKQGRRLRKGVGTPR